MVWNIFTKAIFLYLGCLVVLLLRYSIHLFSVRRTLRHVPGPRSSSLFWGEEWLLYHTLPGSHYVRWHQRFGKIVKFTGAFGVRFFNASSGMTRLMAVFTPTAPSSFHNRPSRYLVHSWRRDLQLPETQWSSGVVQGNSRRRHSLGGRYSSPLICL